MIDNASSNLGDGPEKPRRSQVERSDEARKTAIDAAVQLLVTGGVSAASTSSVALKAGMSRGRLTHQFPTKDAFLLAICEHLVEMFLNSFSATQEGSTIEQRVAAIVHQASEVYLSDDYLALLHIFFGAAGDSDLTRGITRTTERIHEQLPLVFHATFSDFDIPRGRLDLSFRMIIDVLRGMAIGRFLGRSTVPVEVELAQMIRIVADILDAPGDTA